MNDDAYEVCRYVQHYYERNGYVPNRTMMRCSDEFFSQLVANGVVEVRPLYEGGPPVNVVLTEKGARMASAQRRSR